MRLLSRMQAVGGLLGLMCALSPGAAQAIDATRALQGASQQISAVNTNVGAIQDAVRRSRGEERGPAARIADAVLLMGSKDYERAATVLNEVVEKYPRHPTAHPDALALLGETYFRSKQFLSARRSFQQIVARSAEPRFATYQVRALGRLVDIALRLEDHGALDGIFAEMSRVPPEAVTGALSYARGKGLFVKRDYAAARAALSAVDAKSNLLHQAGYLLALVAAKEATPPAAPSPAAGAARTADATGAAGAPAQQGAGEAPPERIPASRYAAAIGMFQQVTQLPPDTPEHRRVIDLAWMAIGRLFYGADEFLKAAQAYSRVERTSAEFGTMLYELAWVYVRLGDVARAQRALEVLAVAEPDSQNIADGSLLRGDLNLRAGRFDRALKIYEGTRASYDPMRARVEAFLGSTSDPAVYYDKLSQGQIEVLDTASGLPPIALQWAREAEDGAAAFAIIDDTTRCRELLKQSNDMVDKLNALLSSPNRVRAFTELKAGEERALALLNQLAMARLTLGEGMDDAGSETLPGAIGEVRARRRSMQARLRRVPVTEGDFQQREQEALKQWNGASQALQRLNLQVDTLQATVNGLRRMLREGPSAGMVRDPSTTGVYERELWAREQELSSYRQQMDTLRRMVSAGRVQVGFGDQRFVEDAQVRRAHREALNQEVSLALQGAGGADLAAYARRLQPLLRAADGTEASLEGALQDIEREVGRRSSDLQRSVAQETANVVNYSVQLEALDREARLVVGQVAMRNFGVVRDRLKNIVLRADVGITEQAWEVREEQMTRVRSLQVERTREDKLLRDELNEVLDDGGDTGEAEEGERREGGSEGKKEEAR
ncbi:tetratricopeptide repeat protein [Chondromyces apiculatus]|uniref:Tetratricopeptide repeat protein n=1 Tax=Chondromyces apiculatus DSM 436 TaxID=1192034 RepID=A0A017TJB9_9BACT|nr:tetratricopeptide repeat protein [Chondromyces apiculatus]EYF08935.1 Hypothetical protein CAP_0019 [Chondromyces apiculatus DSM 436]